MGLSYEVGDIVTLKKVHPCGSRDWEILACRCGFSPEMYRLWAPDYGSAQNGRKKHEKSYEKRKIRLYRPGKLC